MLFKEAISKRIYELCMIYDYTPNKLAELSSVAPSTLQDMLTCKVSNPSSYVIYRICKTLNISIKEFYDSDLFNFDVIED